MWLSCEAGRENLRSSGSHGIRFSGIKGGNFPGRELVVFVELELAVAGAGAGAGAGALGQPGIRSPWFTSV